MVSQRNASVPFAGWPASRFVCLLALVDDGWPRRLTDRLSRDLREELGGGQAASVPRHRAGQRRRR